jgi:hypothetical protein
MNLMLLTHASKSNILGRMKTHPKPLTLEKCSMYFAKATSLAFSRAINAGQEVMGARDGELVIFKKGQPPVVAVKKASDHGRK